jgi:hypothetical protein
MFCKSLNTVAILDRHTKGIEQVVRSTDGKVSQSAWMIQKWNIWRDTGVCGQHEPFLEHELCAI